MNQPADMLVELLRREKNAGIKPDEDLDVFMKALALEGKQTSLVAEYIMKILGLDICADTIVGDEMIKGISGGQKKRLTTGCANLGCYFSLSGFLTGMKSNKAKQMLKSIPLDRILLETDAPDALPKLADVLVSVVPVPSSDADTEKHRKDSESQGTTASNESLNHPENIYFVLKYVASLLEMPEAELAELSYKNATKLFSYPCSKIHPEAEAI